VYQRQQILATNPNQRVHVWHTFHVFTLIQKPENVRNSSLEDVKATVTISSRCQSAKPRVLIHAICQKKSDLAQQHSLDIITTLKLETVKYSFTVAAKEMAIILYH
jgi:hypothetical protein